MTAKALIRNYRKREYVLKEDKPKYVQNDYELFAKRDFERKINYIIMDIDQALKI